MGVSKHREPAESWGLHTAAAAKLSYCRSYHVFAQSHHGVYSRFSRNKYQTLCMWNKQQWKQSSSWLLARKPVALYTFDNMLWWFLGFLVSYVHFCGYLHLCLFASYDHGLHGPLASEQKLCMCHTSQGQWMNVLNIAHRSASIPVCHLSATCLPVRPVLLLSVSLVVCLHVAGWNGQQDPSHVVLSKRTADGRLGPALSWIYAHKHHKH